MAKPTSLEQALAFFDRASQKLPKESRPANGFFTTKELAKAKGKSWCQMRKDLDKLVEAGLAEVKEGRSPSGHKTQFYGNFK